MVEPINGNVIAQNEPAVPVVQAEPVQAPAAPVVPQVPVEPVGTPVSQLNTQNDRTREQFEKLLESNRRLFEANELLRQENERRRAMSSGINAPQSVTSNQQQVNTNDFVERDPITGEAYINEQRLRARIEELQNKANKAEQTVQNYIKTAENREVERQEKETYSAYPELNPNSKDFDSEFNRAVRATLTDSFYSVNEYGGKPLSFKEAADFVRKQFPKQKAQSSAEADAQAAAAAQAAQAGKEQGAAQAVSQPRAQVQQQASDEAELDNLRYRTRYLNDDKALAQRIMHTEHILPKDASES
jgi:hypothetical protein